MSEDKDRHIKLKKTISGKYARKELVLLGLSCSDAEVLVNNLAAFMPEYEIGYLDADHKEEEGQTVFSLFKNGRRGMMSEKWEEEAIKRVAEQVDILIINGNHHEGLHQVIFANEKKRESVLRRKEQIKSPVAFFDSQMMTDANLFFQFFLSEETNSSIPILRSEDQFFSWIKNDYLSPAKIKGLVLVGGKSERMGEDKTQLNYKGEAQWKTAVGLLQKLGIETYVSCRSDQSLLFPETSQILDKVVGIGPLGAMISAFMEDPESAWLVMAADMPDMNEETIKELIEKRNSLKVATAFVHTENNLPEPLAAIYEPKAYTRILNQLSRGISCPRKFLINSDVERINIKDEIPFRNINTPEEREKWMRDRG